MQKQLVSSQLKVTINSFGAELCSVKNNNNLEFIWQANKAIWARHAPVLFPIVGKLKDNFFVYENIKHELSQHGFARDLDFKLIQDSSNSCTFELTSNPETLEKFPFEFVFQINYLLLENNLITSYKVINPSNKPLFFSVGAHPGFNCPLLPNESFTDYYLEFEKNTYELTELDNGLRTDVKKNLTLTDNKLVLNADVFNKDALVFENSQINKVSLCSSKSAHKVTLESEKWPFFGIWSKSGSDDFICLEPWHGIADTSTTNNELVNKDGIIELAPNTEFNCSFSILFN
jgi:galactose mutarotase-like enzyme